MVLENGLDNYAYLIPGFSGHFTVRLHVTRQLLLQHTVNSYSTDEAWLAQYLALTVGLVVLTVHYVIVNGAFLERKMPLETNKVILLQ